MPGTGWTRKTRRCERSGKITMNETLSLVPALLAGVLLGAIVFGGLWWTIRKGFTPTRPALWFLGSMLLRTSIALAGFYFMARDHGERLLGCLLGWVPARRVVWQGARAGGGPPGFPPGVCHGTTHRDTPHPGGERANLLASGGQPCTRSEEHTSELQSLRHL